MPSLSLTVARRRRLALVLVALVALVLVWRHVSGNGTGVDAPLARAPIRPVAAPPAQASTASGGALAARLVVDVVGAVHRPGLYRLPLHARIADAVRAAGGLTGRADPLLVNLAAPLADGEQVLVAARGSPAAAAGAGAGAGAPVAGAAAAPVDLNAATAEQLDTLPGIGPVTAQKIVAYRQEHGPFTSVAGLDAIPGIGPARIDELRGLVLP